MRMDPFHSIANPGVTSPFKGTYFSHFEIMHVYTYYIRHRASARRTCMSGFLALLPGVVFLENGQLGGPRIPTGGMAGPAPHPPKPRFCSQLLRSFWASVEGLPPPQPKTKKNQSFRSPDHQTSILS